MITVKVTYGTLDKDLKKAIKDLYDEGAKELARIGNMYVEESRNKTKNLLKKKIHKNITYKLKNGHSYRVYYNGSIMYERIELEETASMFEKAKTGVSLELLVGDGTFYASFVESKGFDVCSSGFLLVENEVRKLINKK